MWPGADGACAPKVLSGVFLPKARRVYVGRLLSSLTWPAYLARLLGELGDAMGEARHFAARRVLMNDASLRCTHDYRFRFLERGRCHVAVAGGNRFLNFADRVAQQRAARLVDFGLARDLTRGFTGGTGIGHESLVDNWRR
jgi:hypothetical protein